MYFRFCYAFTGLLTDKSNKMIVDSNNKEIKEGDILTFDWFYTENAVNDMRRKFSSMKHWTRKAILLRIHRPTFIVKKNDKGVLFGEGIKENEHGQRLYLHGFRFKYTKFLSEA